MGSEGERWELRGEVESKRESEGERWELRGEVESKRERWRVKGRGGE